MIQSTLIKMAIAGTLAGLLSSFVVSPVELLKIRMQAQNKQVASAANHRKMMMQLQLNLMQLLSIMN